MKNHQLDVFPTIPMLCLLFWVYSFRIILWKTGFVFSPQSGATFLRCDFQNDPVGNSTFGWITLVQMVTPQLKLIYIYIYNYIYISLPWNMFNWKTIFLSSEMVPNFQFFKMTSISFCWWYVSLEGHAFLLKLILRDDFFRGDPFFWGREVKPMGCKPRHGLMTYEEAWVQEPQS